MDDKNEMTIDVTHCSRCGAEHAGLKFLPLTRPIEVEDGSPDLTHWAACPTNGEPVLMFFVEVPDELAEAEGAKS